MAPSYRILGDFAGQNLNKRRGVVRPVGFFLCEGLYGSIFAMFHVKQKAYAMSVGFEFILTDVEIRSNRGANPTGRIGTNRLRWCCGRT